LPHVKNKLMERFYKGILIITTFIFSSQFVWAQEPVSVNPELEAIFNSKIPKEYIIAGITVVGAKAFDANLIISISGMAVGDKVTIPGTDVFGKAISKLWRQSLISDIEISLTRLEGKDLYVQFEITERPRLAAFRFEGIKKGERDDLEPKVALVKDRVVTENMRLSAVEAIRKFYFDKGFRNVDIQLKEEDAPGLNNAVSMTFYIKKGRKVKVNSINFSGNGNLAGQKLKKQMKGTKEMNRITLFPIIIKNPFGDTVSSRQSFNEYIKDVGFMSVTKTRDYVDPYFRIRGFSGAKFNET
jgi:outer membrane protein insertion porin family